MSDLAVRESEDVIRLRREIAGLEIELAYAKDEAAKYKIAAADAVHAVRALRKLLEPFRVVIGMVYGEISRVDAEAVTTEQTEGSSKWASLKQRLGGKRAEIIDVLLIQGEMTITQVAKALRSHYNTAQNLLQDLHGQGILVRNGNAYSLKR